MHVGSITNLQRISYDFIIGDRVHSGSMVMSQTINCDCISDDRITLAALQRIACSCLSNNRGHVGRVSMNLFLPAGHYDFP